MAGRKLFSNKTPHSIHVTLLVRASEDPANQAGTTEFRLQPGESQWQEYGNDIDIYLNGITVAAVFNGQMSAGQHIVIRRGEELDNQLNTRNAVDFRFESGSFIVSTRQVN